MDAEVRRLASTPSPCGRDPGSAWPPQEGVRVGQHATQVGRGGRLGREQHVLGHLHTCSTDQQAVRKGGGQAVPMLVESWCAHLIGQVLRVD